MLVRSWNLYHGNTSPPGRRNFLEHMVRLASEDRPEVLCVQEVPAWALRRLGEWSGMTAFPALAQRPTLGPFPSTAEVGRRLTAINPGLLRSAFSGQGNAILTTLEPLGHWTSVLNPPELRERTAVDQRTRRAWAKERRVCQATRLRLPDGQTAIAANLHATGGHPNVTLAEIEYAVSFVSGLAIPEEPVILAGDFNITPLLTSYGFGDAAEGKIDHVLVRGLEAGQQRSWPEERRRFDGLLLSDHAPVEREAR